MATLVKPATSEAPVTSAQIISAAAELKPILASYAADHESNGRVSSEAIELMRQAHLLNITQPVAFGGMGLPPSVHVRAMIELGAGCPSSGWCAAVANINALSAALWPLEVQQQIWAQQPGAIIAGAAMPSGSAVPVDGGYMVSGKWPFASNCDNSEWVILGAMVQTGDAKQAGWFLAPRDKVSIDHESWRVCGLQGTGSKTLYAEEPFFVPKEACVFVMDLASGNAPGHSIPDNPTSAYPILTFSSSLLVAPVLGMARGALEAYVDAMRVKARASMAGGPSAPAAAGAIAQARVGHASALIDSAIALLVTNLERAEAKIDAGETLTVSERVRLRRDAGFAARQAVAAINHLAEGAGASSSDLSQSLQRFWRDANAGSRHVSFDAESIFAMVGQEAFGLPVTGPH